MGGERAHRARAPRPTHPAHPPPLSLTDKHDPNGDAVLHRRLGRDVAVADGRQRRHRKVGRRHVYLRPRQLHQRHAVAQDGVEPGVAGRGVERALGPGDEKPEARQEVDQDRRRVHQRRQIDRRRGQDARHGALDVAGGGGVKEAGQGRDDAEEAQGPQSKQDVDRGGGAGRGGEEDDELRPKGEDWRGEGRGGGAKFARAPSPTFIVSASPAHLSRRPSESSPAARTRAPPACRR